MFDIPGIYQNSPDYERGVQEGKAEALAEAESKYEEMQEEIDNKQYEIDIRQEAFDEQYKFFEEIKEKYLEGEKPKGLTLKQLQKEFSDFEVSRRGREWDVTDFFYEVLQKVEPEVQIKYETEYVEKIIYKTPESLKKVIEQVIKLLTNLI